MSAYMGLLDIFHLDEACNYFFPFYSQVDQVLVIAGVHSERFDHIMANLATLFKVYFLACMKKTNGRFYVIFGLVIQYSK